MLFFDLLPSGPKSWKSSLDNSRYKLLKRGKNYRLFEKGIEKYEEEIDIVTLIRNLRWLMMAVTELMKDAPDRPGRIRHKTLE